MVRKTVQTEHTENNENKKVGDILKDARLAKKLSIEKVSDKTRIGTEYLVAIEASDFEALPGQVYASGFVRTYAKFLGLDAGAIYDRFRDESSVNRHKVNLAIMEPEKEGGVPHKKEILVAIGALIFIYAVWNIFTTTGSDAKREKAPDAVVEEVVKNVLPEKKAVGVVVPKSEAKKDNVAAAKPALSEKTAPQKDESETVEQVDLSRSYGANDGETRVVLVANSEVWLQITDDDKVIFSRVLAKGDRYNVPDYEYDLTLRAGNAAGVDVYVDGNKLSPLGKRGTVARDISIDADSLLNRY